MHRHANCVRTCSAALTRATHSLARCKESVMQSKPCATIADLLGGLDEGGARFLCQRLAVGVGFGHIFQLRLGALRLQRLELVLNASLQHQSRKWCQLGRLELPLGTTHLQFGSTLLRCACSVWSLSSVLAVAREAKA